MVLAPHGDQEWAAGSPCANEGCWFGSLLALLVNHKCSQRVKIPIIGCSG